MQLWVALHAADRDIAPSFDHLAQLPTFVDGPATATVIVGEMDGVKSAARLYSPLVAAEIDIRAAGKVSLPLNEEFEHGVITLDGEPEVDGARLGVGPMLYAAPGRRSMRVVAEAPARLLLLGGTPFDEQIVMWWNFVGPSHDAIVEARRAWEARERFGEVLGFQGERLPAPPLPMARLKPRNA